MKLTISGERGYLHVAATGKFSLADAKRTFIEILEAVARTRLGKVLVDGRELWGSPEFMDRFYYGKFAAQALTEFGTRGVFPSTTFAYVMKPPLRDPERFGENVARNRGMAVKTFENPDDALEWLGVAPTNPHPDEGK